MFARLTDAKELLIRSNAARVRRNSAPFHAPGLDRAVDAPRFRNGVAREGPRA